ncbi:dihydrofolate reductase family protein [Streptomyces beijiangensis]|uniref:Dihydrofolate reductase family protein n=1 Tax=Streptomyces beijiangensis TaxID=163361 RepID=A0A939F8G9_9ACTN|nr:dihydrofolate reductase family protein [Streptomyces beijiangensis]MBO0513579.1 dihydrofolate reductase family protein [Streptomyces beijiangensis]
MPKLRVHNLTVTLDGFASGVGQRPGAPFGDGVDGLHEWAFAGMRELTDGKGGIDAGWIERGDENIGATIMGRNMFGPVRGPWQDESWTGWWGENPPYHHDVFVHTHHLRPSQPMEGGTVFHFTDEPVETVLRRAFDAAGGQDVRIGGGPATVQQYLRAGLVDEMHVVVVPLLAGRGERLFDDLGDALDGYRVAEVVASPAATHSLLVRR